jgi:hypothetical protein
MRKKIIQSYNYMQNIFNFFILKKMKKINTNESFIERKETRSLSLSFETVSVNASPYIISNVSYEAAHSQADSYLLP